MPLSFPITDFPIQPGPLHTVRGRISAVEETTPEIQPCPPLADFTLWLSIRYLVPNGDVWMFPPRRLTPIDYSLLMVDASTQLRSGVIVARTSPDPDGSFVFTWKELATADRTPYLEVYWVSDKSRDPDSLFGYKKITVKRVYQISGSSEANPPRFPVPSHLELTPNVFFEFWGNETEKRLPPLSTTCVADLGERGTINEL